jgi:hypothetical protein
MTVINTHERLLQFLWVSQQIPPHRSSNNMNNAHKTSSTCRYVPVLNSMGKVIGARVYIKDACANAKAMKPQDARASLISTAHPTPVDFAHNDQKHAV